MSKAEEAALKAYPEDWVAGYFDDPDEVTDDNEEAREYFQQGYEQAEKDLALTWQDVAILITIYEQGVDNGDYHRYNEAEWMKEYSQDILRRFNKIRKK